MIRISTSFALIICFSALQLFAEPFSKDQPFTNTLGMKFVPLPGSAVAFGAHEVTREQFATFSITTGYVPSSERKQGSPDSWQNLKTSEGFTQADNHPVVNVNWKDAVEFCKWMSKKENITYRLPTDFEWSLAVGLHGESNYDNPKKRSKEAPELYYWGRNWPPTQPVGNFADRSFGSNQTFSFQDGFSGTAPVGSFKANFLGIYDLDGNVAEWVSDWYQGQDKLKTIRGVSYRTQTSAPKDAFLSGFRDKANPHIKRDSVGFRVVISIDPNEGNVDSKLPPPPLITSANSGSGSSSSSYSPPSSGSSSTSYPSATNSTSSSSSSSRQNKPVYMVHSSYNGVKVRSTPSTYGNSIGSFHNQYDVVMNQIEGPKTVNSAEWAKVEAIGWMPVKVNSYTFLKKEGSRWRVTWNRSGDAFVSMRSGPSSSNKLVARVNYNQMVEELDSKWVGSRHYIKAKFTGWVTRKNGGVIYVMDKRY